MVSESLECIDAAMVLMIAMAGVGAIRAMFSSGLEPGRRPALFGSAFLASRDKSDRPFEIEPASHLPFFVALFSIAALILGICTPGRL